MTPVAALAWIEVLLGAASRLSSIIKEASEDSRDLTESEINSVLTEVEATNADWAAALRRLREQS